MSAKKAEQETAIAAPRETSVLFGHREAEDLRYHEALREAYRQIAAEDPDRCVLIDATPSPDVVATQVWTALRDHLFAMATSSA